jgi:hypothetical protein
MEELNLTLVRHQIIHNYARWCAFSSTRSGSLLKSRADIYPLIDLPEYHIILKGTEPISKPKFEEWHERSTKRIHKARPEMVIGWCTKLINLYLKTMVYVGQIGRPGLMDCIHPPIDGGLWDGIKEKYAMNAAIMDKTHKISKIKEIEKYEQYQVILEGIEMVARAENCSLLEVEKLWKGTEFKTKLLTP